MLTLANQDPPGGGGRRGWGAELGAGHHSPFLGLLNFILGGAEGGSTHEESEAQMSDDVGERPSTPHSRSWLHPLPRALQSSSILCLCPLAPQRQPVRAAEGH